MTICVMKESLENHREVNKFKNLDKRYYNFLSKDILRTKLRILFNMRDTFSIENLSEA
jgi:hypothetical protein